MLTCGKGARVLWLVEPTGASGTARILPRSLVASIPWGLTQPRRGAAPWHSSGSPKCNLRPPERMAHGHGSKQVMPPTHGVGHPAEMVALGNHPSFFEQEKATPSQGGTFRSATTSARGPRGLSQEPWQLIRAGHLLAAELIAKQLPAAAGELGPPPPGKTSPPAQAWLYAVPQAPSGDLTCTQAGSGTVARAWKQHSPALNGGAEAVRSSSPPRYDWCRRTSRASTIRCGIL